MEMKEEKELVASFMGRCYSKGLTTSTGGNLSMRVGDVMLITPSGKDKSSLVAEDIAEVDIRTGENLTPEKKLSIETEMHRRIYQKRPDAVSVMHSHPTFCCLFSSSDEEIDTTLIAESWYLLDRVKKVPYALMGTEALAERVSDYAGGGNNALLLENHGALAVGKSVLNAFDRLECMEQAAKLTFLSRIVKTNGIGREGLKDISDMR
ncbi:MAG: class II aldolase/adducin family protein [Candidatus Ornithospirochaeta sp.]